MHDNLSCTAFLLTWMSVLIILLHEDFADGLNVTFEPCVRRSDCRKDLLCLKPNGLLCTGKETGCRCSPTNRFAVNFCSAKELTCPQREGCAKSRFSKQKFCVACTVINRRNTNYPALRDTVCSNLTTLSPTPVPSPRVLRNAHDLCGVDDPCRPGLSCRATDSKFACNLNHFSCHCESDSDESCTNSGDCDDEKELCVKDASDLSNKTYCASCNRFKMDANLEPVNSSDTDRCTMDVLPVPSYYPRPNGQSFDNCTNSAQCKAPLKCVTLEGGVIILRTCKAAQNFPRSCSTEKNCPNGEMCAILDERTPDPVCVSSSKVREYERVGILIRILSSYPSRGWKNIGAKCKADWQCSEGLQCLFKDRPISSDEASCTWRNNCTCQPFYPKPCVNGTCARREKCMEPASGMGRPFCTF